LRNLLLISLVMLLIVGNALSQSRGFLTYSVADGLAQSNVMDIGEDRSGNLWLATFGGLSKFNGIDFENFDKHDGLGSNRTFCLSFGPQGTLWVGTSTGISQFDGREFTNYPLSNLGNNQWVSHLLVDSKDQVWFATTAGGLYHLMADSTVQDLTSGLPDFGVVSGIEENEAGLWVSTYQGLYHMPALEGALQKIDLPDQLMDLDISAIFADDQQRLWLGTSDGLYYYYQQKFDFAHSFHQPSQDFAIFTINKDKEGAIWLGTTHGAYKFQKGVCTSISAAEGLTDNIIYKIHRDREGTLWFGSFGGGVFKSLGELFTHIGKKNGMNFDYVSSISRGKAHYWFGSYGGGVYKFIPGTAGRPYQVDNLSGDQGLSNNFVFSTLEDDSGVLWAATAWGLNRYVGAGFKSYYKEQGLPSNQIYALLQARDGLIYGGTANGLTRYDPKGNLRFQNYIFQGTSQDNRVRSLLELSDGRILLGTQGGLKVFNGTDIQHYFKADSLQTASISAIYQDQQGNLWCGLVDEGIMYYQPETGKAVHYTEMSGLSSNIVYSLAKDKQNALWVGTPRGLDKITFNDDLIIEGVRNFAAKEGFFGIETNTNALLLEPDGSIWFGTVSGAYLCNPLKDQINELEPITFLTGIQLFSQDVDWSKESAGNLNGQYLPHEPTLKHSQNHITFQFIGNSLKNPQKVRYQYKLENFDRAWQPVTSRQEAVYTNIPPGFYEFKVKASNNDGVWNSQPVVYAFEIAPPFWRTWWFYTLVLIAVGVLGRLYYNFRVQKKLRALLQVQQIKLEETVKVRKRVAEDFHDQVGNQLASITVLVQLIQAKINEGNKEIDELLQKLGQFTKTLFTGTRDFIWSIDPKSDNVNEMLIYIRDFGEELFEYSGINFYVDTNDTFDTNLQLPVGWSRHVVFIFKEALTNSLKHANCSNVYLNFNVEDHNFVFELKDDGQGLNGHQESENQGMGLRNMKERAKKISSNISISSENGGGTVVTLAGKIPQDAG